MVQAAKDVHVTGEGAIRFPLGGRESLRGHNDITNKLQARLTEMGAE
jgi:hypothetical protein